MIQIRIQGRGGQGVVSASQIMSVAAFHQGRFSQSFPSFGSERTGAPVKAYVRFDDREIELREPVIDPDVLIVQDETLFHAIDVFSGLQPDGWVLINTRRSIAELGIGPAVDALPDGHLRTIPATDLALRYLKRPTPNTVLLGAFAAMTGLLEMNSANRPSWTSSSRRRFSTSTVRSSSVNSRGSAIRHAAGRSPRTSSRR